MSSDSLDRVFEPLRSRGASLAGSFPDELEDRLMREQARLTNGSSRAVRRRLGIALALFGVLAAGAASYAATDGWAFAPRVFWFSIDENGDAVLHEKVVPPPPDENSKLVLGIDPETGKTFGAWVPLNPDGADTSVEGGDPAAEFEVGSTDALDGEDVKPFTY